MRKRKEDWHWVPEKNAVTGFTWKGLLLLIAIIVTVRIVKSLFW